MTINIVRMQNSNNPPTFPLPDDHVLLVHPAHFLPSFSTILKPLLLTLLTVLACNISYVAFVVVGAVRLFLRIMSHTILMTSQATLLTALTCSINTLFSPDICGKCPYFPTLPAEKSPLRGTSHNEEQYPSHDNSHSSSYIISCVHLNN